MSRRVESIRVSVGGRSTGLAATDPGHDSGIVVEGRRRVVGSGEGWTIRDETSRAPSWSREGHSWKVCLHRNGLRLCRIQSPRKSEVSGKIPGPTRGSLHQLLVTIKCLINPNHRHFFETVRYFKMSSIFFWEPSLKGLNCCCDF